MHPIIHPFNHPSVHSSTHSFTHRFIHPPFHSSTIRPSTHPHIHSSTHPNNSPSIRPLIHPSAQMQPYSKSPDRKIIASNHRTGSSRNAINTQRLYYTLRHNCSIEYEIILYHILSALR